MNLGNSPIPGGEKNHGSWPGKVFLFFLSIIFGVHALNVNTSDLSLWLITLGSKSSEMNKEAETNQNKPQSSQITFG